MANLPIGSDAFDGFATPKESLSAAASWDAKPGGEARDGAQPRDDERNDSVADSSVDSASAPATKPGAVLVRMSDVEPQPVQWLWPGHIPIGKLTLLVGDPGLGKSFLTLDIASRVTRGSGWPVAPSSGRVPGSVVLLSAEDDAADTIRPRLDAAGADCSRVVLLSAVRRKGIKTGEMIEGQFCLQEDLACLEDAIVRTGDVQLVVIDPVTAYLGRIDSHRTTDVRSLLAPLSDLAARYHVAVLAVTHNNKNSLAPALYRATGSLAFVAAARSVIFVAKDKTLPERRLFLPEKSNLARKPLALAYSIVSIADGGVGCVAWEPEPVEITADEALAFDGAGETCGEQDAAVEWLREELVDGPLPAHVVQGAAREHGISKATLRRASIALKICRRKEGFQGPWQWRLPSKSDAAADEGAEANGKSTFGSVEHLWTGSSPAKAPETASDCKGVKGAHSQAQSTLGRQLDENDDERDAIKEHGGG